IKERDFRRKGLFGGVVPAPATSAEIQDNFSEVRLVIVHPRHHYSVQNPECPARSFVVQAIETRGDSPRVNQNMLVFAVDDRERRGYLMDSVREYLAWYSIFNEKDLPLLPDQRTMAEKRSGTADETVWLRLTQAYNTVLYPVWDDSTGRVGLKASPVDED